MASARVFRLKEAVKAADLHSVLSPLWGKTHGSEVVDVKILTDVDKTIKYNVKDAVKGYCGAESQGRRLLMSRNWLPPGYRAVDKVLTEWALCHGANWKFDDDLDSYGGDYIAYAWEQKRDYVRRWLHDGKLKTHNIDGIIRITEEAYKKFIGGTK